MTDATSPDQVAVLRSRLLDAVERALDIEAGLNDALMLAGFAEARRRVGEHLDPEAGLRAALVAGARRQRRPALKVVPPEIFTADRMTACAIGGVYAADLDLLDWAGLVQPRSPGSTGELRYGLRELVLLRLTGLLREAGLDDRGVRHALGELRGVSFEDFDTTTLVHVDGLTFSFPSDGLPGYLLKTTGMSWALPLRDVVAGVMARIDGMGKRGATGDSAS